ncbi:MAG: tetratricopeptide repeat protein [Flavobacteriales bacterium]|nr:tetratricopeptide repeat protein [Flavobacteriales bacterium]MBK6752510.1 tetratricopeptide repeat protein [Flavobacteriales bacterium]MBK7268725.1 tetratricopeptide repeat protein [Flavobacteriales bacterium]MBK7754160.1 tetratricopeptide repeat protein [Flavobacteriales bacterium]MBK9074482.1 tetratricopeptide repeat protein [Flavobacteriales bacterium]
MRAIHWLCSGLGLGSLLPLAAQDVDRLIAEGDSLVAVERYQKALDRLDQAVSLQPSAHTYTARARAWYAMDRVDRFLLDVEQALKTDSTHPEANYQRALYALRGEDYRGAERYSDRGLRNGAQGIINAQLLLVRGEANAELHREEQAITDLRAGLEKLPDDLDANRALARTLDAHGDHEGSLKVVEHLCTLEPKNVGHWTNRGYELIRLERWESSLEMFDRALELDRDEPVALSNRAYALMKLGRNDEAIRDVERSLRFYPANSFALRTRALLRLRKGELEKGCADLSLARILGGVEDVDALIQEHCGNVPNKR